MDAGEVCSSTCVLVDFVLVIQNYGFLVHLLNVVSVFSSYLPFYSRTMITKLDCGLLNAFLQTNLMPVFANWLINNVSAELLSFIGRMMFATAHEYKGNSLITFSLLWIYPYNA